MGEKSRDKIALFRFSLIVSVVNGTVTGTAHSYFEEITAKKYQTPDRKIKEFIALPPI